MVSLSFSRKFIIQYWVVLAQLVLIALPSVSAPVVKVTDLAGAPVTGLPFMNRGDVRIIPLSMLGKFAGFEISVDRGKYLVESYDCQTTLSPKNSFAEVNGAFVQLPVPVEVWDGSLWIPLQQLPELFPTTVELGDSEDYIRLLGIVDSASGVVTPLQHSKPLEQVWTFGKVILDPGHGGKDPGCKGLLELEEKFIVLDIAKRTETALKAKGIPVVMTRRDDKFLTLGERTRQANAESGDLFISLHCNHFTDPDVGGAECYILKPARTERAIDVAARENQVVDFERDAEQYDALTEENYILLSMATSQYLHDSETWAEIVIDELKNSAGMNVRGVDQAGFYVLMGASMPAILLECGYLSNPDDARMLGAERGRQRIADAIAMSIVKMKSEMEAAAR